MDTSNLLKQLPLRTLRRRLRVVDEELRALKIKHEKTENALQSILRFFSEAPLAIDVIAEDYTIFFANQASKNLVGARHIEGKLCYKIYNQRERPCDRCPMKEVLRSNRSRRSVKKFPKGALAECIMMPIELSDGKKAILSLSQDISSRFDISNGRSLLDNLITSPKAEICQADEQLRIVWTNKVFEWSFGRLSEITGKTLCDVVGCCKEEEAICPAKRALDTGKPSSAEMTIKGRPLVFTALPIFDEGGDARQVTIITTDINEQKRTEKSIRKRNTGLITLHKISRVAEQTLTTKEFFFKSLPLMADLCDSDFAAYYNLEENSKSFVLLENYLTRGMPGSPPHSLEKADYQEFKDCLRNKDICIIRNLSRDCPRYPATLRNYFSRTGINSIIILPIKAKNLCFGVMILGRKSGGQIEEFEEVFLLSISKQIATTVERIKLFETLQRNLVEVMELQKMGYLMSSTRELDEILKAVCNSIVSILGYPAIRIHLDISTTGSPSGGLPGVQTLCFPCDFRLDPGWEESIEQSSLLARKTKIPQFLNLDEATHLVFEKDRIKRPKMCRSVGIFPMFCKTKILGTIEIFSDSKEKFGSEINSVLHTLASQAAMAIENAELIRHLEAAMEEISDKEQFLSNIIENSADGIMVSNEIGEVARINRAFRELTGVSPESALKIVDLLQPNDQSGRRLLFEELLDQLAATGPVKLQERILRRTDGTEVPVEVSMTLYKNEKGAPSGVIVIVRDIRERLTLQEQLFQTEKLSALGEVISGVAHELNNPLTGVIGFSELLAKRKNLDEKMMETIDKILKEANRCKKIVANLLAFSRKHASQRTKIHINSLIEEVLQLKDYELHVTNIKVKCNLAPDLPDTMGDPYLLQQTFFNIINNAHYAMTQGSSGGVLTITTEKSNQTITIRFSDTGPGISKELQNMIFDPFFTTKSPNKGTGLGLSLSYKIVERHGGSISVESSPGAGATFIIRLPIIPTPEEEGEPRDEEKKMAQPKASRILVVDDERAILELLTEILKEHDHTIRSTSSASEALREISRNSYDCIISDLKMPEMDGKELYQKIKEFDPGLAKKLVFITGDFLSDSTERFILESGIPFIKKPFSAEEIEELIHKILSRENADGGTERADAH